MKLFTNKHEVEANRFRNIVNAIDNLIVQLGHNACVTEFHIRLRAVRDVYEHEMVWHMDGSNHHHPEFGESELFDGNHSRDSR